MSIYTCVYNRKIKGKLKSQHGIVKPLFCNKNKTALITKKEIDNQKRLQSLEEIYNIFKNNQIQLKTNKKKKFNLRKIEELFKTRVHSVSALFITKHSIDIIANKK